MILMSAEMLWANDREKFQEEYSCVEQLLSRWLRSEGGKIDDSSTQKLVSEFLSQDSNIQLLTACLVSDCDLDFVTLERDLKSGTGPATFINRQQLATVLAHAILLDLITPSLSEVIGGQKPETDWDSYWTDVFSANPALDLALRIADRLLEPQNNARSSFEDIRFSLTQEQTGNVLSGTILAVTRVNQRTMRVKQDVESMRNHVQTSVDSLFTRIIEICGIMIAIFAVICTNLFVLAQSSLAFLQILTVNCAVVCALGALSGLLLVVTHPYEIPWRGVLISFAVSLLFGVLLFFLAG